MTGENDADRRPGTAPHRGAAERAYHADPGAGPSEIAGAGERAGKGSGLIIGEILAWRFWWWQNDALRSPFYTSFIWIDGFMSGDLTDHYFGSVWSGGVHSYKDAAKARHDAETAYLGNGWPGWWVWGSVRLWGEVVEHETGYRAEFARIISLDGIFPNDPELLVSLRTQCGLPRS
jgi:hypothetical protein